MMILRNFILLFCISFLMAENIRPLVMKPFDSIQDGNAYQRGNYLIIKPESLQEMFLTGAQFAGNFVTFKKSQGFDVNIVSVSSSMTAQQIKDDIIMPYYEDNPLLEYVLLIGDVNGPYSIPTFTINSYNEEDIDVTDYPYTFTDDQYEPKFFIGRWPIRSPSEVITIKVKSMQYVTMDNITDYSYLNNSLLVAGNYKTADGEEVLPSQWPVTPVWTSKWLMEELQDYGYAQVDTAFFHAGNWETGEQNPLIENAWDEGVGVINYRGWGDANGWHKPYFHTDELLGLNNGWNLPILLSFVCNTGDFGNDYSGTGLSKCFGEVAVTAGSPTNPKGAAAMVGPSDLDTDTRFNNLICGLMWDSLLDGTVSELAPALHVGKQGLIYEFSGLTAPDGTVIDAFYHHVYSVLGDPSIPVRLLEPGDISADIQDNANLTTSYINANLTDGVGDVLDGIVGALLDANDNLIAKGVSNSQGQLIIDFDTDASSDLTLYLNAAQYKQKSISLNYVSDDGSDYSGLIPINISVSQVFVSSEGVSSSFHLSEGENNLELKVQNNSSQTLNIAMNLSTINDDIFIFQNSQNQIISPYGETIFSYIIDVPNYIEIGTMIPMIASFTSQEHEFSDYNYHLYVSNQGDFSSNDPSPQCNYGYKAFDHTDTGFIETPVYNWFEINNIGTNLNLTDDSVINNVPIGFDFKYFGQTYNSMTVCSNGWISFEHCDISHFWNFSIPNAMGPNAMIAPFMDDLDDNGGTVDFNVYAYNTGDGRFIIEWDDVLNGEDDQNCPDCITETFQMILYDPDIYATATGDGDILFQYKEIHDIDQNGNYSTIGIESPDQEDGVQYLFSTFPGSGSYWELNNEGYYGNLAIKFTTGGACAYLDVNGDNIVNIVDVIDIVNIILGLTMADDSVCTPDVNFDSIINVVDIIDLVNYILQ